ncbi:MAG: bile acid:sodium symporter family protein [Planctomycetales bacterium]|nr:bile acid:sodium symporter family protein [Planctomycetales bacterium]
MNDADSIAASSKVRQYLCYALLALSGLFALACVFFWSTGRTSAASSAFAYCFLSFAFAASTGHGLLRQLAFTIWIVTGVTIGMTFHSSLLTFPPWFFWLANRDTSDIFIPVLQIIMFAMGTTLSITDFTRVFQMPTGVLIGLACQFTIMPLVGFGLARTFGLQPEIAAGLVLVGCSPSGLASNVMAFIAKANVAMSVTMTAFSTLLAPLLTPIMMKVLAGELVEVDVYSMMWSMAEIVLLPVFAGLVFHHSIYHRLSWLDRVMPVVSMVGILIMTVLTVAIGRDKLMQVGALLIVACLIHSTAGFALGYGVCKLLGLDRITCRTISLEVGLQNSGMAAGLAKTLGKVATLGLVPIVFGPVMNTVSSILANWWRAHPADDNQSAK